MPTLIAASVWMKYVPSPLLRGQSGHDSGSHRLAYAQRIANCEYEIADLKLVRIPNLECRQILPNILKLKYGKIRDRNPTGEW